MQRTDVNNDPRKELMIDNRRSDRERVISIYKIEEWCKVGGRIRMCRGDSLGHPHTSFSADREAFCLGMG